MKVSAKNKGVFAVVSLATSPDNLNSHVFGFGAEFPQPFEVSVDSLTKSSPYGIKC